MLNENCSQRTILYLDPDDFYASIVRLKDSTLRGKPVLIAHPGGRGGVVSASYEARGDGVAAGMTTAQALRLCPKATVVPVAWDTFERCAQEIHALALKYSPLVERTSLDESALDITGCQRLFGAAADVGASLQRELAANVGLDVSVGVGSNKLVSQVAALRAKRKRLVEVFTGYEPAFLSSLPVNRLPDLEPALAEALEKLAVRKVSDLAKLDLQLLEAAFGFWGRRLHEWAHGIDQRPVSPKREELVRTARADFPTDEMHRDVIVRELFTLAERLGETLRAERFAAGKLGLTIGYSDTQRVSGSRLLPAATDLDRELYEAAERLLERLFIRRVRVRSLILVAGRLRCSVWQRNLFGRDVRLKWRELYSAVDKVRGKYGQGALRFGRAEAPAHKLVVS